MKSIVFKGLLWLMSKLNLTIIHYIGWLVGNIIYIIPNKARYVSKKNIDACFADQSGQVRNKLLRLSLIEASKAILELGPMWLWPSDRIADKVVEIEGIETLEACLTQGRGLFAATPHLGAWELCGLIGSQRFPFTAMYRPPKIHGVEDWIRQARERVGATLVAMDGAGLKAMYRALERGEVVGMLPDQEPRYGGGVFAPFFGVPALTMTLISKMARKTDAAVFLAYMRRYPSGRGYKLVIHEVADAIRSDDEVEAATALNQALETCIRACPEQYLWAYRRFKQRPEGEPPIY
ncbi:MAG: lipid A biosynthesis acyltransferase [Gammaproteobacteria bacterium]|nr:MAG: lipid A biosynthesis acyltransferase [Gammaproteobacteria bacterium]